MSDWIKALILGAVEGITEFLPISSTGHLIVVQSLLDFPMSLRVTFSISIQIGAILAVLMFYRDDLRRYVRTFRHDSAVRRLWLAVLVALLPSAIIGLAAREILLRWFQPGVVMTGMVVGGSLIVIVEFLYGKQWRELAEEGKTQTALENVTFRQAITIGFAQVLALFPGMSRSATSIIGGMFAGMSRQTATQFSFLLAIPTLFGATLVQLLSALPQIQLTELGLLLVGGVSSAIVGWLAVRWLLRYVSQHSFMPFGIYRLIVGTLLFVLIGVNT